MNASQKETPILPPGLHRDIPFEVYQQIKLPNSSAIGWGMCSMKHMKACVEGQLEDNDTKDRKFGRAVHCILLEPDSLETRFKVALPCQATLASGNRKGERCGGSSKMQADDGGWYCGVHCKGKLEAPAMVGIEIVSPEEDLRLHKLRDSLRNHPINKILHRSGWSEVSAIWERDGVMLKGRIDRYAEGAPHLLLDIKKCQVGAGSREDIEKSIVNYGWYRQAFMYCDAVFTLTGEEPDFGWVVVEDGPPFDVNYLPIDAETLSIGRSEVDRVLTNWRVACAEQRFSGYLVDQTCIVRGGVAEWYRKKFNQ
jgi:hypothetical protein